MDKLLYELQARGYVNSSNEEIIAFGLKRIFELVVDILGVVLCGAIMGNILAGLVFELAYIPLRVYAGGYHASSEKRCNYLSEGSTFCCLMIIIYLSFHMYFQHLLMTLSITCIVMLSPFESVNKPLNKKEKQMFRNRSMIVAFAEVIVYILTIILNVEIYARAICIAMVLTSIGLLAALFGSKD